MRALAIVALCTTAAHADPPVQAGPQDAPPVASTGGPRLEQELDGRRNIRGCGVGESCVHPAEVLREFEIEAFPPPGASPWIDERTPPRSRLEASSRKVVRPSELRPDQPWLDTLELPDLPVRWSQRLIDYLLFYKNDPRGRAIIGSWLEAQGRYRDLILAHLRKARLPEDLLYVAMIESSYDPMTLSSAGALGLWQFMPEGARIYGLRQDRWVDERRDPLRATIAVVDYWHDLYQRFGDWHIAMAAFNVGYGAMLRSIARYNTNDYYQLCEFENGLPWETCLYTPKVLATAIVGHNRAVFGFDKLKELPAEAWEEIRVPTSIPLGVIARAAGVPDTEVKRLNPHLRRDRTPPGETAYVVRVPRGTKADYARRIVELQTEWDGHDAYVIAHGERLEDVATTYGISLGQLKRLNQITRESEISGGTVLVVPRISAEAREKNRAKAKANLHASGPDQKEGEPLLVAVPDKDLAIKGKERVFYRVVSGDTLRSVAGAFGIKQADLIEWNALEDSAKLHPRMILQVFVDPAFEADKHKVSLLDPEQLVIVTRGSEEHLDLAEARTGRVRTEYVSKGNEKLGEVARRYGMGAGDLARINRISYNTVLEKGQKIIVYQVADPTRSERAEEQWRKTPKSRRGKRPASGSEKRSSEASERGTEDKSDATSTSKTNAKPDRTNAKPDRSDAKPDRSDAKPDRSDAKPDRSDAKPTARTEATSDAKPTAKSDATREAKGDAKTVNRDKRHEPSGPTGPIVRPTQVE